jgi:transposase
MSAADSLPEDVETLKAMLVAAQAACLEAEAKARNAEAEARARALLIEQMKFTIAKLRHERFGQSSERGAVLEQLKLWLSDMEEDAGEAEAAGQMAADAAAHEKIEVQAFHRRKPARRPLPRASAARARRLSGAELLPVLRRHSAQARRGRDRDAGARPAPVEGDPARA